MYRYSVTVQSEGTVLNKIPIEAEYVPVQCDSAVRGYGSQKKYQ